MSDDEVTSGGGSRNTSDDEGGYDSSDSYLDSYEGWTSPVDYCYSEEENYVSENDDTCDEDVSERRAPDSKMVYGLEREEHGRLGFRDDKSSKMEPQTVKFLVGEHSMEVSCGGTHSVALTRDKNVLQDDPELNLSRFPVVAPTLLHLVHGVRKFKDDSELYRRRSKGRVLVPTLMDDLNFKRKFPEYNCDSGAKDIWKRTWPKRSDNILVNVYGYYNKDKRFGGHAVILRDMSAAPIAATANYTRYGKTYLHHVLEGIEDGLALASKHGCSSPTVLCNSRLVVQLLRKVASDSCRCDSKTVSTICVKCMSKSFRHLKEVYLKNLVSSIETVQTMRGSSTFEWDSGKNEAVHYLAKQVKSNSLRHGYCYDRFEMEEPEDYTDKLVNILFMDACNFDERVGIAVSKASTGNTSKDGDKAGNDTSGDIRDGSANVVAANITSSEGTDVGLSTGEKVMTSDGDGGKGKEKLREKCIWLTPFRKEKVGDKNGGERKEKSWKKPISAGELQ